MGSSTLPSTPPAPIPAPAHSGVYRFWRAIIRLWFALTSRRIRVLHSERLEEPGPALLVVNQPESFLEALMLVAGIERPLRCIIPARLTRGLFAGLMARGLGMISFVSEDVPVDLEKCCALLVEKEALVTFAKTGPGSRVVSAVASLAVEAESRCADGLGLLLFPVHLFLPVKNIDTGELLIDIDQPENVQDSNARAAGTPHGQAQELAKALERKLQVNSFGLQSGDLERFLDDIEQALQSELQEEQAAHPAPKQNVEGFELSQFVVEWAEQMNSMNPGLLVSLIESLEAWRESRRLWARHRIELEGAGEWLNRPVGRSLVWLESVAGFAIAIYGLINHLVALGLLWLMGLLKKENGKDKVMEWVQRGLVVFACYAAEVYLVAHYGGRRAAGYYAPTLPISGLYLWRYATLLPHQTRIAFLSMNLSAEAAKTQRRRKAFLREINEALDQYAAVLDLPR